MARLPSVTAKRVVALLERNGFVIIRQRGSHATLRHADGRQTTVPMHRDVPKGTLRSIMRQTGLTVEDLTGK